MSKNIKYIVLLLLSQLYLVAYSQTNDSINSEDDSIFYLVETIPVFPGGEEAMFRFLRESISYPKADKDQGIQGLVIVAFVVEKDGSLSNFKVLKSVSPGLDEEALRVVKKMPDWSPATQLGKNVRVEVKLPIRFTLEGNTKTKKERKAYSKNR